MDNLITEASLFIAKRPLGGLLPFNLVEIEDYQRGVVVSNEVPVQVLMPGRFRWVLRSKYFDRYVLWIINAQKGYIKVGEGKICISQDGWRIKGTLTAELNVVDPRRLIGRNQPVTFLQDRLFSALQNQIGIRAYQELLYSGPEIEMNILALSREHAHDLGFSLERVTFAWEPEGRDPRSLHGDVMVGMAQAPKYPVISPGAGVSLPPGNVMGQLPAPRGLGVCPFCGGQNRPGARFCSKCGKEME
jgi:hypothetical protein